MELSDAPEKIPSDRGTIPGPADEYSSALTARHPPSSSQIKERVEL